MVKESNISKILTDSITKKLIILILGMILGLTVISEDMYLSDPMLYDNILANYIEKLEPLFDVSNKPQNELKCFAAQEYGHLSFFIDNFNAKYEDSSLMSTSTPEKLAKYTNEFNELNGNNNLLITNTTNLPFYSMESVLSYGYVNVFNNTIIDNNNSTLSFLFFKAASFSIDTAFPIINITLNNNLIYVNNTIKDNKYRENDVIVSTSDNRKVIVYRSIFYDVYLTGILNIIKTLFIMSLIIYGAIAFESNTKKLVLDPLEIMIEIVEMVEQDPIIAKNAENLKSGVKNLMTNNNEKNNLLDKKKNKAQNKLLENSEKFEVKMIQNSIVKISGLLAICFGEAGGDIIKQNLEKGKDFNPMIEGKKKNAIFGFCDIRQFPLVNDALQERTIIFVNQISEIVHSSIDRFSGATNKNIGDSYLSAWRFIKTNENEEGTKVVEEVKCVPGNIDTAFIADQSILGFLETIIKINSDPDIIAYQEDPSILKHPGLKNYRVKMGFGLHTGWGIEGAIGSNCKIDASYLSPNVNISARLKEATKQYGVLILISGELYDLCSSEIKNICRLVDRVAVKGSINPIKLYTIDTNIHNLPIDNSKKLNSVKKRYELLMKIKDIVHMNGRKKGSLVKYVLGTKHFKKLLSLNRNSDFLPNYKKGIDNYLNGNWTKAGEFLSKCLEYDPMDGPSKTIYNFIQSKNFNSDNYSDAKWQGYRALTSK